MLKECREFSAGGNIKLASRRLHEHLLKHFLPGRPQGQAGASLLLRAAVHILEQCVIQQVPPPERLLRAFELLHNIKPEGLGDHARRVAYAAQFPTVKEVNVSGLARAHLTTHQYTFKTGEAEPVKTKLKEPIGTAPDRGKARELKEDPEFREEVELARLRGTPKYQKRKETAAANARRDATRFQELLAVVESSAAEAETAPAQQYREGRPGPQSAGDPGPNSIISIEANSGPKRKMLSKRHAT